MRKYDIPYVKNGPVNYFPAVPLQDMSLDEIKKKYIKTCGKANGDVSVCSKCPAPCPEGKRAIQLIANEVYDAKVPLFGGKTLIEKAREENRLRREKMEAEKNGVKKQKRTQSARYEGWWEDSIESGDQIKWLMTNYGLSKTQAKKKVYQYRYNHNLTKEHAPKEDKVVEEKVVEEVAPVANNKIETKLDILMKQQEDQKKAMNEYYKLYEQAKVEYENLKLKIDTLCSAMDILNE